MRLCSSVVAAAAQLAVSNAPAQLAQPVYQATHTYPVRRAPTINSADLPI